VTFGLLKLKSALYACRTVRNTMREDQESTIAFRVTATLHSEIRERAAAEERTVSSLLRHLIRTNLNVTRNARPRRRARALDMSVENRRN
jgi:hypothetical protein